MPSSDAPTVSPTEMPSFTFPTAHPVANISESKDVLVNTQVRNVGIDFAIVFVALFLIGLVCMMFLWTRLKVVEVENEELRQGEPSPKRIPRSSKMPFTGVGLERIYPYPEEGGQGEGDVHYISGSDSEGGEPLEPFTDPDDSVDSVDPLATEAPGATQKRRRHVRSVTLSTSSSVTSYYDWRGRKRKSRKRRVIRRRDYYEDDSSTISRSSELYQKEGDQETRKDSAFWRRNGFPNFSLPPRPDGMQRSISVVIGLGEGAIQNDNHSINSSLPPLPGRLSFEL